MFAACLKWCVEDFEVALPLRAPASVARTITVGVPGSVGAGSNTGPLSRPDIFVLVYAPYVVSQACARVGVSCLAAVVGLQSVQHYISISSRPPALVESSWGMKGCWLWI